MSENTKLYGYLIYNEPEFSIPPLSAEDVIITSANTITDIGQVVAREMKDLPNGLKMLKIIPSAASGITFTAIDIALSWSSEGPIQAIVTGVVTTGVSCAIGVVAAPIIVGTSATAITTGVTSAVIGGIVSILVGKLNDGIYDFAEREIANITKNNVTGELTLNTDLTDISDIKQLVDPYVSSRNPQDQQQINKIVSIQDTKETIYTIKNGDTVWDICQKYGLTYDELIDANPWLADRFSDDMEFALIKPEEQLYIPENVLRESTTHNESFETVRDIYTGEKSPSDLINYEIPEDSQFYS